MSDEKPVTPFSLFQRKQHLAYQMNKEVAKEIADARYAICKACPLFRKRTKTCSLCGCNMKLKTLLSGAQCPDDPPRWDAVSVEISAK